MPIAMGFVAVVSLGTLMSLKVVSTESDVQAASRQQRQAAFAAEAGLAEARERLGLLQGDARDYTVAMGVLPRSTDMGDGAATDAWYDVFVTDGSPWLSYTLERGAALDETELPAGVEVAEQRNVRYRVFLRDDEDERVATDNDQTRDVNEQVWLVAVGEVTRPGGQPVRAVVRALVSNNGAPPIYSGEAYGQKGGDASKSFNTSTSGTPDLTRVRTVGGM
ncbi:hypothetical protein LZ198_26740 [Myxococcus sp. K15C18031901]|uniref:hypothetical protein n=1 Tax=Myxococcus dinghuensis TaxID=2906761 RepID=UPI0020A7A68E|nr:hypothetical protein [Myxococcus dinghuensis]MCP3102476.1 hypothetical protein [Myxococcus dinghuensis]